MICPNCKTELPDDAKVCATCGNPFGDERPWEIKTKPSVAESVDHRARDEKAKVSHQQMRSSKTAQYLATQEQEYYLNDEFVIATGYCGYTEKPDAPEELREGTVILTKKKILFGNSDHAIRCGKFVIEIPLDAIVKLTDRRYKGRAAFELHVDSGEIFIVYVANFKQWVEYFSYVLEYTPSGEDYAAELEAERESMTFMQRWGKAIFHLICAVFFLGIGAMDNGIFRPLFIVFGVCFLFLTGVSIFAPEKLRKK